MYQGKYLQKNKNQGWELFEDLAVQWEPTPKKSKNTNSISSKGGPHVIESFIAVKARMANIIKRMEALEAKELAPVNQVNSPKSIIRAVPTAKPWATCSKSVLFYAQQMLPKHMNAAYSRFHNNSYSQTYNPGWRNHLNFSWRQNNHDHPRSNSSNSFQPSNYQQNFPNQVSPPFQNPQRQDWPIWRKVRKFWPSPKRHSYKTKDNSWTTIHKL